MKAESAKELTPYQSAEKALELLPPTEQLRLISQAAARLSSQVDTRPRRSITELEGLGKEVWDGVDVEQYLKEERSSWER